MPKSECQKVLYFKHKKTYMINLFISGKTIAQFWTKTVDSGVDSSTVYILNVTCTKLA